MYTHGTPRGKVICRSAYVTSLRGCLTFRTPFDLSDIPLPKTLLLCVMEFHFVVMLIRDLDLSRLGKTLI